MPEALRITKLNELVATLDTVATERFQEVLSATRFEANVVERHAYFTKRLYTRNLIARTDSFELLALCWMPGHCTPIHDHSGSGGWVLGITGRLEEVRYNVVTGAGDEVRLEPYDSACVTAGGVSYIDDEIGLHKIENIGTENAISLHLYAPPIDECRYFDEPTGHFKNKRMSYHSVDGIVVST